MLAVEVMAGRCLGIEFGIEFGLEFSFFAWGCQ
jgi:hypothetical protein